MPPRSRIPCSLLVSCVVCSCAPASSPATSPQDPAPETTEPAPTDAAAEPTTTPSADDERGGQLFDKWYAVVSNPAFVPDDPSTPGVADGQGGPNGNGTLNDADGKPVLNDGKHNYRFKSFFGWDLRGSEGLYGPEHHAKAYVAPINLLTTSLDAAALQALIRDGGSGIPAYGSVLDQTAIEDLVAFIVNSRDGKVARPDQIYVLDAAAPKHYRLLEGADVAAGHELFSDNCSGCHGDDGTDMYFDGGGYSLGSHARAKAYEDWFKVLNGHPGSSMDRQVDSNWSGEKQSQAILNILAALCDRTKYPAQDAKKPDVEPGDSRCGAYLR